MKKNINWFTLIELLISMTIFFIIVTMTYVNYAYYQNIAKVKISVKELSQSINEARNLAISWYDKNWINQSIWILFDLSNSNEIKFYNFNYNSWIILNDNNIIKIKKLQDKTNIKYISWKNKVMIYFSSIYAKPEIYDLDLWLNIFSTWVLDFSLSFWNSTQFPLKRELKYIKSTNVVDY